ncbi:MAG: PAS domain S-box protein [Desulfobacteraceae bacterium]|nr:PAS domain S-box protein [Desulfobacteraceae bacterium]
MTEWVNEDKFRMLAENSRDLIYRMSLPDGEFEYISPAATEIFGYTPQEFYQKSIRMKQIMHPDWKDYLAEKWTETLKGKVSPVYEYQIICKTGEVRWIYQKNTLIRDLHGNLMAVEGVATDITKLKQAERMLTQQNKHLDELVMERTAELQNISEALEKEKEKYRLIFNKAPVGIIHYDSNGIFTECNPQFAKIIGTRPEKLIGFNTLKDTKNESVLNAIKMSLAGKTGHYEGKYTSVTAGHTTHVRAEYVPVFGDNHTVVGGICVAMDISKKIKAETAVRENEKKARALLDATNDAVVLLDKMGTILDVNKTMAERFYKRIDEIMGACIWDFLPSNVADERKKNVSKVFETGKSVAMIDERQEIWNYIHFYPLFNETGDVVRVAVFAQDITDQKKAEDELKNSHERLRNLSAYLQTAIENERKSIAREIHDDLGQTLTAIKMDTVWLQNKIPADWKMMNKKSKGTISLVDSAIQTVKRISAELRPGLLEDLGLSAAIEWQAKDYQKRSGINIHVTIEPEEIFLEEDLSIVIFRICQETLTNIIRHSGATNVRVQLIKNSETVVLVVEDNGVGISEKEIAKKDSFGLIGMRERVHALGGRIKISRLRVGGTKVAVKIPIRTDPA